MKVSENTPSGADEIADCLESFVLSSEPTALSLRQVTEFAENYLQAGSASTTFAIGRMRRRCAILKEKYPIDFDVASMFRREAAHLMAYTHLLLLSGTAIGVLEANSSTLKSSEESFEELVLEAVCNWLGPGSSGVRFGWPSEIGRPAEFPDAIRWLSEKMNVELGSAFRPPIRKDGGVDVIVWRPFADNRSGFPIVLAQCTLQKDLISKSRDVDLANWSGWLLTDRPPTTVLATPRTVDEASDKWAQLNRQTLIMERIRLSEWLPDLLNHTKYQGLTSAVSRSISAIRESVHNC